MESSETFLEALFGSSQADYKLQRVRAPMGPRFFAVGQSPGRDVNGAGTVKPTTPSRTAEDVPVWIVEVSTFASGYGCGSNVSTS